MTARRSRPATVIPRAKEDRRHNGLLHLHLQVTARSCLATGRGRMHGAQFARFFGDLPLVEPGIVPVSQWRSDGEPAAAREDANIWAVVARVL